MRAVRRLLVGLVLLGLLLVVADRAAAWVAQRMLADQVATELSSRGVDSAPPEVSFDGLPFLTQVAAGRYEAVTVRLRDVGSEGVRLPLVELTATGVTASASTLARREGPVDAERVVGAATVGYDDVTAQAGLPELELSAGGDGGLRVQVPAELLGTPVVLAGGAEVTTTDGSVTVQVAELAVQEPADPPAGAAALAEQVAQQLSVTVPLPPLPYGLAVESVRAEPTGLVVAVSARDVPLAR